MPLLLPPHQYSSHSRKLRALVTEFNTIATSDHIQRLFYLQKINYLLNNIPLNASLYNWINNSGETGWLNQLNNYSVNPNASFFVKGIQFAQAVCAQVRDKPELDATKNEYVLMQERDELLKEHSFDSKGDDYISISCHLDALANSNHRICELVAKHSDILTMAAAKLNAIQGKSVLRTGAPIPSYKTQELGRQVNNINFKFHMGGWVDPFIFRVEDRAELGLEQELHSFKVAKYFIEDFAVFMMEFKGEEHLIEHKPVVLSQFANQGNLAEVAKRLNKSRNSNIGPITSYYFIQVADFCTELMAAKAFHPDIKLTNLLVHNNRVLISDRKTLLRNEHPTVAETRSTPFYAPEEYINCLNEEQDAFNPAASTTRINMPQFMAYQLGMALKEFLISTQRDELPDEFREIDRSAASYFKKRSSHIVNLSLLAQELTRPDPTKRLSIKQFKELLSFCSQKPDAFYQEVEKVLSSKTLGIEADLMEINELLESDLSGKQLLQQANIIFNKLSYSVPKETRLTRMAERLAVRCYNECSAAPFFAAAIEEVILNKDWEQAPWYRQALHWLSFGYFRVERVTSVADIKDHMISDLNSETFQSFFPLLVFLPPEELNSLEEEKATHFKSFIYNHLEEILSNQNKPSVASSNKSIELECASSSLDNSIPSAGQTSSKNPLEEPEVEEEVGSNSGSMVVKKTKTGDSKRFSFFKTPITQEEEANPVQPKPAALLTRANTIRASLFRGDGSNRKKPEQPRGALNSVNWEPPAQEAISAVGYQP